MNHGNRSKLMVVLESHIQENVAFEFLRKFIGSDVLETIEVVYVARNGTSFGTFETEFDTTNLSKVERLLFKVFVSRCCD